MRMTCTYLTSEHGTEIVTASSQHNPMGREVFLLHPQCHITKGAALPEGVHWVEDGLGVSVCHYVFRGHNAAHQALWRKNRGILGQYSYMKDHIWRNEKMNTRWALQIKELKEGLPSTQTAMYRAFLTTTTISLTSARYLFCLWILLVYIFGFNLARSKIFKNYWFWTCTDFLLLSLNNNTVLFRVITAVIKIKQKNKKHNQKGNWELGVVADAFKSLHSGGNSEFKASLI